MKSRSDTDEISVHILRFFAGLEEPKNVLRSAGESRVNRGWALLACGQLELGHGRMGEAKRHLEESLNVLQGFYFQQRSKYLLGRITDPSRHADWWKSSDSD